ncbi:hypothetical protein HYW67_04315 [Candidatus Parcubacteria bacterium]|nr:hypothetical protein [Candidatus Parcubacteria bacterium]
MSLYTRNDKGEVVDAISRQRVPPDEQAVVLAVLTTTPALKPADEQRPCGADPDESVGIEFWES